MKLVVVSGYSEFLRPRPIEPECLLASLRDLDPVIELPLVRWLEAPTHYHTFLYSERSTLANLAPVPSHDVSLLPSVAPSVPSSAFDALTMDQRVDFFLEYLADTTVPGVTVCVVLPFESWVDHAHTASISDPRLRHLIERANSFGVSSIQCVRLALPRNAGLVLKHLQQAAAGDASLQANGTHPAHGLSLGLKGEPVTPVELSLDLGGPHLCVRQNYSESVLRLGEVLVDRCSIFTSEARAERVQRCLEQSAVNVGYNSPPEQVLRELEPGGVLFDLLSRPDPVAPAGAPPSSRRRRRAPPPTKAPLVQRVARHLGLVK